MVDKVFEMDRLSPDIVAKAFNIDISVAVLHRLKNKVWLNDDIINFYFGMIVKRSCQNKKVYAFNSFFMGNLLLNNLKKRYDYDNVTRWTNKFNPFDLDKLFVPIHVPGHWTFVIVCFQEKVINFYDSMHGNGAEYRDAIMNWLEDEAKKRTITFDRGQWETKDGDSPSQKGNGTECGVFVLMSADYLSADINTNIPLSKATFGLEDMPQFRRQIARDIIRGKLDGDNSVPILLPNDDQGN
jgi:sentrin-specific protease 1